MDKNIQRKIDTFLACIASRYMEHHQGDILIDHDTIIDTLDERGEIELYVAKMHFDTEERFRWDKPNGEKMSVEEGRQNARKQKWGEIIVTLKVEGGRLKVGVEVAREDAKTFPSECFNFIDDTLWNKKTYESDIS